ncbi:MAG TPA: hypothetical protein VF408_00170 [Sediminibacterium sp.]
MNEKLIDIKDDELLQVFRYKYEHYQSLANKYKKFIDAMEVDDNAKPNGANVVAAKPKVEVATASNGANPKKTFEQIIIDILKDGKPRTTKMLIEDGAAFGLRSIPVKNVSSKLSICSKQNGKIKNLKFSQFPKDESYWWGLKEWFVGHRFKDEYERLILSQVPNNKPLFS